MRYTTFFWTHVWFQGSQLANLLSGYDCWRMHSVNKASGVFSPCIRMPTISVDSGLALQSPGSFCGAKMMDLYDTRYVLLITLLRHQNIRQERSPCVCKILELSWIGHSECSLVTSSASWIPANMHYSMYTLPCVQYRTLPNWVAYLVAAKRIRLRGRPAKMHRLAAFFVLTIGSVVISQGEAEPFRPCGKPLSEWHFPSCIIIYNRVNELERREWMLLKGRVSNWRVTHAIDVFLGNKWDTPQFAH